MKKLHFILPAVGIMLMASTAMAQNNLVPNGSFDNVSGRVKRAGSISMAEPWYSPTDVQADLFSKSAKGDFSAPENMYGREVPEDGDNYAGFVAWSYRDASPRSYLTVELDKPLTEGKIYCVKFMVSLSDISKYAVNNIGAYLSTKKVTVKDLNNNSIEPQVMHSANKIYDDQYYWQTICQTFKSSGKEKYLTIGNFAAQDLVKTKKLRRPKGFTTPQIGNSYYYIENVSIINMAEVDGDCACGADAEDEADMNVVYNQNVSDEMDIDDKGMLELQKIFFESNSSKLDATPSEAMGKAVKVLKANPSMKVEIMGHADAIEQAKDKGDLSMARAEAVKTFLVENGVAASQLTVKGYKDQQPATEDGSTQGLAQNRRVTFKVMSP
ncbi:MAG: OmpA family protein [Salibacteraceae bacterium]